MNVIDCTFTTASLDNTDFSLPIKTAMELGKHLLNKYYNLMDKSEIYRTSISAFTCSHIPPIHLTFYDLIRQFFTLPQNQVLHR